MIFGRLTYPLANRNSTKHSTTTYHKMIQRTLISGSRALSLAAHISRPCHNIQSISAALPAPARARILSRWYSATSEAAAKPDSEAKIDNGTPVEDPKDKELAAKTKEVIELKVCIAVDSPTTPSRSAATL